MNGILGLPKANFPSVNGCRCWGNVIVVLAGVQSKWAEIRRCHSAGKHVAIPDITVAMQENTRWLELGGESYWTCCTGDCDKAQASQSHDPPTRSGI